MSDNPADEIRDDEWAIDVSHVTKRFRLQGSSRSLKTAALDLMRRRAPQTFTALDDVSLRVKRGETVGIVGANGAGKSTLLSIIAGTLRATSGTARTRGSVSSLLELGAGFHPDLTGRENVMLYGAIMGIPRETMRRRFDEIVDFAGLEEFIDQPVRFYSSGMYVRLGFSVAVQVDPDVLLVDEVLAVGDADFQRKCLGKMDEFRARGKSLLLISHDIHTVRRVADRVAYLARGRMLDVGDPLLVSEAYMKDSVLEADAALAKHEWGTGEAKFTRAAHLDPATGKEVEGTFECTDDRPASTGTPTAASTIPSSASPSPTPSPAATSSAPTRRSPASASARSRRATDRSSCASTPPTSRPANTFSPSRCTAATTRPTTTASSTGSSSA